MIGSETDPNAYIFSLVNNNIKPFKDKCKNDGEYAIYCNANFGPGFGGDIDNLKDICINSDSNTNYESKSMCV